MKVLRRAYQALTLAPLAIMALILFVFLASCGLVPSFHPAGSSSDSNDKDGGGSTLDVSALPDKAKPYVKWVLYASKRYAKDCPEVTPQLLAAQIQQESGWNPKAESPAGAQGISQFMPGTWKTFKMDVATKDNEEQPDGNYDVFTAGDAITAQARYDCALVRDVKSMLNNTWKSSCKHPRTGQMVGPPTKSDPVRGGIQELMLAAYNSGPCNVSASRGVSDIGETKHYVKTIMALMHTYEKAVAAAVGGDVQKVISLAEQQIGKPYVLGAPSGSTASFDCSSLVQYVYKKAVGVSLPRTSQAQAKAGRKIDKGQPLQPGDLLIYSFESTNDHIGLYVGNSTMIHARNSRYGVVSTNVATPGNGYATTDRNYQFAVRLMEPETGQNVGNSSGRYVKPSNYPIGTPYHQNGSAWSKGYHTGVDFLSPSGKPVVAVGSGKVVSAGWSGSYGYEVIIRHSDGGSNVFSEYAHMIKGTLTVKAGDTVEAGKVIGKSGETGNAFGPHLHFEIRREPGRFGDDIDPVAWLRKKGVKV
ncbi:MAG: peptidoglycan DD-metalloendopeptidase family protein [Streptomycetaceae bacterium]|jgi:cell wall-associated NlpC family hydrolase|nr:peptidoglycan DD-metalloendopeptidase family protein [Streptomycetaceae bacterium]NUS58869.1 peptidoglycan DD-metalloendopeptidase family protein [Streptomycetaceae bacterium]